MSNIKKLNRCYPYLKSIIKYNTLTGLPILVKRDIYYLSRFELILSYIYEYVSVIWVSIGFLSALMALTVVWTDVNLLFGCVSSTSHTTQILLKIIWLNWFKTQFLQQLRNINIIIERNKLLKLDDITNFSKFASHQFRYLGVLEAITFVVIFIWTTTYFAPFLHSSIMHYDAVENLTLPIVGYVPFHFSVTPRYQLVVICQAIWFYFNNLKTVAVDYFILGYIGLHIVQFKYLNLTLDKLTCILTGTSNRDERKINSYLLIWIKQHQQMVRMTKVTKEMLSIYFLIEFAYIVVHTCVPAFVITSTLSWDLNQKIVLIIITSINVTTLYLLALSGDVFKESAEEFGITFYDSHLVGNESCRLVYHMLVNIGRNKMNELGFSNVYPSCSITFGAILRLAMSAYLALNQIKAFKS